MSGGFWLAVCIGGLIVALLAVFFLRGAGVTTTTVELQGPGLDLTPGPDGAVSGKDASGGRDIFGIRFSAQKHTLRAMFILPPGCGDRVRDTVEELVANADCVELVAEGNISGKGRTAFGDPIVVVDVPVSASCFSATAIGDDWPSVDPECDE